MKPLNLLFILSDEHTRNIVGCYGDRYVETPNLDRLAQRGTRFAAAYCNSPICVPSRASLATGRYVHEIRCWDNAHPYDGRIPSWGHELIAKGHEVTAVGKLHYRSINDPNGFTEEIETMHVVDGVGDLLGLIRDDLSPRLSCATMAKEAGRGESSYTQYDRRITEHACRWLAAKAGGQRDKPWVLFVGFVAPHYPLVAPPPFFDIYASKPLPKPVLSGDNQNDPHPVIAQFRKCMNYHDYFDRDAVGRGTAAYYGLVSFLDTNIGRLLETLERADLLTSTRVMYASDHGECLGNRGVWGKGLMYEESVGVPLILCGADIPAGRVVNTPVSLVDVFPTILSGAGVTAASKTGADRPGRSLFDIASHPEAERIVFSEYHAEGFPTGAFMIRLGQWKYVHYVGYPPQLFDLESDPDERRDLSENPNFRDILARCESALRRIVIPEEVNSQAFADQSRKIETYGGVELIKQRGEVDYTPIP